MRILYIASVRIPNEKASGLAIMRQCEAFALLGHTVTLLRPFRKNHIAGEPFSYYGIAPSFTITTMRSINFYELLGRFGFYVARFSQMIASAWHLFLKWDEIDLVYARDPWMLVFPSLFGKKKIIWEAHQMQPHPFVLAMAKRVSCIVCISRGLLEEYKERTRRNDVLLEPSGVDLKQFEHAPSKETARQDLRIPIDATVIGYIGKYLTMGEEKGVDDLIEAFGKMYKEYPLLHLLIAGLEAAEIDIVKKKCEINGLNSSAFTLTALVQKKFVYYVQAADIVVMNYPDTEHYRNYMSPTKLFAYMASGKTIVASDLPTVRAVADTSILFFCRAGDRTSLFEALLTAYQSPKEEVYDRGRRAQSQAQRFSWIRRGERILDTILGNVK